LIFGQLRLESLCAILDKISWSFMPYILYAWVYVKYLNKHSSIETDTSGHMMENTGETANQDTNGHSMDSFLSGTNRESKYEIES